MRNLLKNALFEFCLYFFSFVHLTLIREFAVQVNPQKPRPKMKEKSG